MQKCIGISISDRTIEAVQTKKLGNSFRVRAYSRIKLKAKVIQNGVIQDEKKLRQYVADLLVKATPNNFNTKNVVISLPDVFVYTHLVKIKNTIKKQELFTEIENEVSKAIPFDLSEMLWTYKEIGKSKNYRLIMWTGAVKEIVVSYENFFNKMKFNVKAIEPEANAIIRLLPCENLDKQACCLIDLGAQTINVSIFDEIGVRSVFTMKKAGDNWTKEIAKTYNIEKKQAEKLKKDQGLTGKVKKQNITLILLKEIEKVVKETRGAINFYEKTHKKKIKQIFLVGGGANILGIDKYFESNLEIKTKIGKPANKISGPSINMGLYLPALGLSLFEVKKFLAQRINVLPEKTIKIKIVTPEQKQKRKIIIIIIAVIIITLPSLFFAFQYQQQQKEKRKIELSNYESQVSTAVVKYLDLEFDLPVVLNDMISQNSMESTVEESLAESESLSETTATRSYEVSENQGIEKNYLTGRLHMDVLQKAESFGATGEKIIAGQKISILAPADFVRAQNQILKKIEYDFLLKTFQNEVTPDEFLVGDALEITKMSEFTNSQIGTAVSSFIYTATAKVTALILIENELNQAVNKELQENLPVDVVAQDFNLGLIEVKIKEYNPTDEKLIVTIKVKAERK